MTPLVRIIADDLSGAADCAASFTGAVGPMSLLLHGEGEGQVPIKKVSSRLTRMRPVLTKEETSVVNKRLKSLGGITVPLLQNAT